MRQTGLENIMIWLLLFVVFGPLIAVAATDSLDQVILQMTPYLGTLGVILLAFLALRMVLR